MCISFKLSWGAISLLPPKLYQYGYLTPRVDPEQKDLNLNELEIHRPEDNWLSFKLIETKSGGSFQFNKLSYPRGTNNMVELTGSGC
jgi:hypothetical protein